MNTLATTVLLQCTGVGATPELASANFVAAINQAMAENPALPTREYIGRPYLSPILPMLDPNGGMAGYQRHGNIAFVREAADPAEGWDYTVLATTPPVIEE